MFVPWLFFFLSNWNNSCMPKIYLNTPRLYPWPKPLGRQIIHVEADTSCENLDLFVTNHMVSVEVLKYHGLGLYFLLCNFMDVRLYVYSSVAKNSRHMNHSILLFYYVIIHETLPLFSFFISWKTWWWYNLSKYIFNYHVGDFIARYVWN